MPAPLLAPTAHRRPLTGNPHRHLPPRPRQPQRAAVAALRDDGDRELFDGRGERARPHRDAREVVRGVVVRAGERLAIALRLLVDDVRRAGPRRDREQRVAPRGHGRRADDQVVVGLEHGGRVRAGAPDGVPRHEAAEHGAAARLRAAVADGDARRADPCAGRVERRERAHRAAARVERGPRLRDRADVHRRHALDRRAERLREVEDAAVGVHVRAVGEEREREGHRVGPDAPHDHGHRVAGGVEEHDGRAVRARPAEAHRRELVGEEGLRQRRDHPRARGRVARPRAVAAAARLDGRAVGAGPGELRAPQQRRVHPLERVVHQEDRAHVARPGRELDVRVPERRARHAPHLLDAVAVAAAREALDGDGVGAEADDEGAGVCGRGRLRRSLRGGGAGQEREQRDGKEEGAHAEPGLGRWCGGRANMNAGARRRKRALRSGDIASAPPHRAPSRKTFSATRPQPVRSSAALACGRGRHS